MTTDAELRAAQAQRAAEKNFRDIRAARKLHCINAAARATSISSSLNPAVQIKQLTRLSEEIEHYIYGEVMPRTFEESREKKAALLQQPDAQGHWRHADGSLCLIFVAPTPTPVRAPDQRWWCTEHNQFLEWKP